jgi:hypothetical protein
MLRRSQFRNDNFFIFGDRRHSVSMLKLSDSSFDFPVTLYTTFVLSLELKPDLSIMSALAGKQRQHGSDPEDDSSKEESNSEGHQISSAEKGSKDEGPPQLVGFWDSRLSYVRKRAFMKRTTTSTFASVADLN